MNRFQPLLSLDDLVFYLRIKYNSIRTCGIRIKVYSDYALSKILINIKHF